jgi:hypothetical protein
LWHRKNYLISKKIVWYPYSQAIDDWGFHRDQEQDNDRFVIEPQSEGSFEVLRPGTLIVVLSFVVVFLFINPPVTPSSALAGPVETIHGNNRR